VISKFWFIISSAFSWVVGSFTILTALISSYNYPIPLVIGLSAGVILTPWFSDKVNAFTKINISFFHRFFFFCVLFVAFVITIPSSIDHIKLKDKAINENIAANSILNSNQLESNKSSTTDQKILGLKKRESKEKSDPIAVYVSANTLNKRTCPSINCGIVGQVRKGDKLNELEVKDGFTRVTNYYKACTNGIHDYVESGDNKCTTENGMTDGMFAEWISTKHLSKDKPSEDKDKLSSKYDLVKDADDFDKYKDIFLNTSNKLIKQGKCTEKDLRNWSWWKSTTTYKNQPIYFTYCGGAHTDYRIYLNAKTGKVFK